MDRRDRPKPTTAHKLGAELFGTYFATLVPTSVDILYYSGGSVDSVSRWLARGFITIALIYAFSEISGAHVNPAISFGFFLRGVMQARLMLLYWIAQFAGGFAAAGSAYVLWGLQVRLGASHPGVEYTPFEALIAEVILTMLVMTVVLATAEEDAVVGKQAALAVGFTVAACGFFAGPVSGASMNPGRSIPPQMLGGLEGLAWIYVAGPLTGAALATALAWMLFGAPTRGEEKAAKGG
ncbi:MAG TPA: aquaporin [Candidatus Acidoferrales bacterium]|nr:aquaporin [Candidatus Acidoferrales bacterium]